MEIKTSKFVYQLKKAWLMSFGWWHAGLRKNSLYGRRAEVLRDGKEIGGLVVIDHQNSQIVILCDDGVIQRGGVFRPVRASCEQSPYHKSPAKHS